MIYEAAILLAIFGLPVAVIALLFAFERQAAKMRKLMGVGEILPPKPAFDEIVGDEGGVVMAKRTDVDETLIEIDRASSYGRSV